MNSIGCAMNNKTRIVRHTNTQEEIQLILKNSKSSSSKKIANCFTINFIIQLSKDICRFTFNRLECNEPPTNNLFDLLKLLFERALSLYGLKFFWLRPEKPATFFCADFESWFSRRAFEAMLLFDELFVNGLCSPVEFSLVVLASTLHFSEWLVFNEHRLEEVDASFRIAYSSAPM